MGYLIAMSDPQEPRSSGRPRGKGTRLMVSAAVGAALLLAGGPFAYPENADTHFGNYEGRLPEADGDYYREFTVETPGLDHRGPRRIVTGGDSRDPDVWYYTDDHYESFCEIPDAD